MGCRHNWTVSYSAGGKVCTKCGARTSGVNASKIKRKRDGQGGRRLAGFTEREVQRMLDDMPGPAGGVADSKPPKPTPPPTDKGPMGYVYPDSVDDGARGGGGAATTASSPTPRNAGGGNRAGWIIIGLLVLGVGGGIWWAATEGIQMATDAVDDAAGIITETIDGVAPGVEQGIGAAVDMVSDAVEDVVEDPGSITDAVVDLLPEAVGPYVLQVDDGAADLPAIQPPEQPANTMPSDDLPQSPLDRTIWPDTPVVTSPTPDTKLAFIEQVEDHVHEMTNEERALHGIRHLAGDNRLDGIARSHSQDMADRNYFDHDTPEGRDPTDRGTAVGYNCRKDYGSYYTYGLAENIFWISRAGSNPETLAREIVDSWMGSPGHRQNILEPAYDALGVGIAVSRTGAVYATQNFC